MQGKDGNLSGKAFAQSGLQLRTGERFEQNLAVEIEDLFDVDEYLKLFNKAFGTSISSSDLGHGDRILKRLTDAHGACDQCKPADVMLGHPDRRDGLSEATLARFETLFERINGTGSAK